MQNNPLAQYQNHQINELEGRALEAAVLSRSANRLNECMEKWDEIGSESALLDALRKNQKIWTVLQSDIEKNSNGLPADLQQNLLMLIRFIDQRTFELMARPAQEGVKILVDINKNIAAGLSIT